MKSYNYKLLAVIAFSLLLPIVADAQCAMCRAVLESEGDGGMAKGINNGIVYLMIFPYLLVGGIAFAIYKYKKRNKA
ncbi:hypothetical protein [Croceibacter atlanticus]|jgi:hypothetical protein|uniref:hypothetical protein n=1 Tax=Croceibacter atlanticus TaxID=313588 RepID=UPI0024BBA97E|nr:hypothetical protein [Croceibacter atlanticus]|tara:strand:+ start:1145 stop:1375 length:231 start_codon:yes stop_codon:yes gene_type:complete